jgi:hypothetical protein
MWDWLARGFQCPDILTTPLKPFSPKVSYPLLPKNTGLKQPSAFTFTISVDEEFGK